MKRDLFQDLLAWKLSAIRKPLILRGARQVGKSWLAVEFGKTFANFVKVDFDKDKNLAKIFQDNFDPQHLIDKLSLYLQQKIVPGETLLFFDEIQECEAAIKSLRYFKEEMPTLHVVAAGSLIDFALEKLGLPVGRVQFLYLYPMSFGEFLEAMDRQDIRDYITQQKSTERVLHEKILELLKIYFWLGGMPAVVDAWRKHKDASMCQELQSEIIYAYKQDFYKYARRYQVENVVKVFESIPVQLGKKFKFVAIDREIRAMPLKEALILLVKAGIAYICYHSSGQGLPLGASKDDKKFKVYFFDIGLMQRMQGINLKDWMLATMDVKVIGALAEQFVAQEFIATTATKHSPELYYWHRESKSSNAEIDFLFTKDSKIIPVEVKSGAIGSMRSLHAFLAEHPNSPEGLKIATGLAAQNGAIEDIPLYATAAWLAEKLS